MTNKKGRSFIRRILRLIGFLLAGILFVAMLGVTLFYVNRDEIGKRLLKSAQKLQPGHLTIGELHLSPFTHFPNVSLRLDSLIYFEKTSEASNKGSTPVAKINHLYVALNIVELIKGQIDVSEITVRDGEASIFVYQDSSVNIMNAIGFSGSPEKDTTASENEMTPLEIHLTNVNFKNFKINIIHQPAQIQAGIVVNKASVDFTHVDNKNQLGLDADIKIEQIVSSRKQLLKNRNIQLQLDFEIDANTGIAEVTRGNLVYEGLTFKMNGFYDTDQDGLVDLELDASDDGLTLLSLFIEDEIINMNPNILDEGDLFISGSVKGKTINHFPMLEFNFGAKNITVNMPDGIDPIKSLGFAGYFRSGTNPNLSEAVLEVKDLNAIIPGGEIHGSVKISDFTNPEVQINWDSKMELTGFDRAFKMGDIDSLSGILSVKIELDSKINLNESYIPATAGRVELLFDDITFMLSDLGLPIQKLSGSVKQYEDHIAFDSISIRSGGNVVLVNGDIQNLFQEFLNPETQLDGNLNIDANLTSIRSILPEWIYLPEHSLFNDSINNLKIDISLETTVAGVSNFYHFPQGRVQINHFEASLENLPDVHKLIGQFNFRDDSLGIDIGVEDLDILLPLAKLDIQGNVRIDTAHELSIGSDLSFENVRFNRLLTHILSDSSETFTDSSALNDNFLNASLKVDTRFSHTPLTSADISITDFDIFYADPEVDTVTIDGMKVNFKNITFNPHDSLAFPEVLSASGEISFNKFKSRSFYETSIKCEIDGGEDKLKLVLTSSDSLSGFINNATLSADMTGTEPSYQLWYELNDIQMDTIAKQYYKEDIMHGVLNLSSNLSTNGSTWAKLASNATGNVLIEGKDLVLYGFDLDEILSNYKKSQNFRLTDVGAYFLIGPFGAVITKGADFARINNINPEDTTFLTRIYSLWTLADEIITAEDVALTTRKSRIALTGGVDMRQEEFDTLTVAVIDDRGCSLMSQSVYGSFKDPQLGDVNVVGTLFGAVINVFKLVAGNRCEPFYDGTVEHPEKK